MRRTARALETRTAVVDPPPRPLAARLKRRRAARPTRKGQMLRRGRAFRLGRAPSAEFTTIVWRGKSLPHARQDRQASSVRRPLESRQRRKSPVRRCFKPRPPVGAGCAGSPPAAGLSRAVDWPLVQIPADRHATTGTCVLGRAECGRIARKCKRFLAPPERFFRVVAKASSTPRRGGGAPGRDLPRPRAPSSQ